MPRKRSKSICHSNTSPKSTRIAYQPKLPNIKLEPFDNDLIEPNRRSLRSNSGYKDVTKIGEKYQASIPEYIPPEKRAKSDFVEHECQLWAPVKYISDVDLDAFVDLAMSKYDFSHEEALGFIHFFKENVDEALQHIELYQTGCRKWSEEEKQIFNKGLQICNKDFKLIQKMLPERSMGDILQMYYKVKALKKKPLISLMDMREAEIKKEQNDQCATESTTTTATVSSSTVADEKLKPTALFTQKELLKFKNEQTHFKENAKKMVEHFNSEIFDTKPPPFLIIGIEESKPIKVEMKQAKTANFFKVKTEFTEEWTKTDLDMLHLAFCEHGLNYEAISKMVATKSIKQIRDYCLANNVEVLK